MKQFSIIAICCLPGFFLSGCMNSIAASVVEDVYEAALMEDDATVQTYFSKEYLTEHPLDELSDELGQDVRNMEGVKLLNVTEHKQGELDPDIVEELNNMYQDDWHFIALQTSNDEIMTWVVLKGEQQYTIVDGKKVSVETYNDKILK